jgi:hypothetical protein
LNPLRASAGGLARHAPLSVHLPSLQPHLLVTSLPTSTFRVKTQAERVVRKIGSMIVFLAMITI